MSLGGVELWTINGDDERIDEVISLLRMALGAAEESEVIHPETASALRQWCNIESLRIHPKEASEPRLTREQEALAALQRSPHWHFWEGLKAGDEVRWTGTKTATYFVVSGELCSDDPTIGHHAVGAYIELRRHSGKTFWTHVGKVRPL